ncbi:hypothetical protein F3C70_12310, partial [Bacteroides ovatus]
GLAIDQIAQSGLSSLSVIYYSAHLFSALYKEPKQEWSFVDKTPVGENDQSEPVQQISVSNKKE